MAQPAAIAVDATGNVYVAGTVLFPFADAGVSSGAANADIFLTKLSPGLHEAFTLYFGGDDADRLHDMAVDPGGSIYLVGETDSANFPVVNATQPVKRGARDAFLVRMDANGGFVYSTYIGGDGDDSAASVAVNKAGSAFVTGTTGSRDFPVTPGAFQTVPAPGSNPFGRPTDAFVMRFGADGVPVYATYLGGTRVTCIGGSSCLASASHSSGTAIAVDTAGNAYIGGATNTLDFPVTAGAFQTECMCTFQNADGFVTKLNPAGSAVIFSTYLAAPNPLPTSPAEVVRRIAVDASGNVFVAGTTTSAEFPVTPGAYRTEFLPRSDLSAATGFLLKMSVAGNELVYSTYLTGHGGETIGGLRIDSSGSALLAGSSEFTNIPVGPTGFPAGSGYFIKIGPDSSALSYATRAPNGAADAGLALNSTGDAYLLGSSGFVFRTVGAEYELPHVLGVANAAGTQISSSVAPGEVVSIYGVNVGPEQPLHLALDDEGRVATRLGDTEVLFDGISSPLTYAGPNQINAVAPFALNPRATTVMEVRHGGSAIAQTALAVAAAEPEAFRNFADAQQSPAALPAAALNQDGSVNSFASPAAPGSIVSLFVSGAGRMEPGIRDGEIISTTPLPKPFLGVAVKSSGEPLDVLFAGQAPGLVAGVVQINCRLPVTVLSRPVVLTVEVDGIPSEQFTVFVQ